MATSDLDAGDQGIDMDNDHEEEASITTPSMTLPADENNIAVEESYNIDALATTIRRIQHFYQELPPSGATQVALPKRATFFGLPRKIRNMIYTQILDLHTGRCLHHNRLDLRELDPHHKDHCKPECEYADPDSNVKHKFWPYTIPWLNLILAHKTLCIEGCD